MKLGEAMYKASRRRTGRRRRVPRRRGAEWRGGERGQEREGRRREFEDVTTKEQDRLRLSRRKDQERASRASGGRSLGGKWAVRRAYGERLITSCSGSPNGKRRRPQEGFRKLACSIIRPQPGRTKSPRSSSRISITLRHPEGSRQARRLRPLRPAAFEAAWAPRAGRIPGRPGLDFGRCSANLRGDVRRRGARGRAARPTCAPGPALQTRDHAEAAYPHRSHGGACRARCLRDLHGSGAEPGSKPQQCATLPGPRALRAQQGLFTVERTCHTCLARAR